MILDGVAVTLPKADVTVPTRVDEPAGPAAATLVLAHGAGANKDHAFLTGFAGALADAGVRVVRFDFPYVAAGRRLPGPVGHATATWAAVVEAVSNDSAAASTPIFAGGKSYGGRMASLAAAAGEIDVAGLVYLGYPFHPPGDPEKTRAAHLPQITVPQVFVEGTTDPFIQPIDEFETAVQACQRAEIAWVDGGGHSFEVTGAKRPTEEVGAGLAPLVAEWLRRIS